MLALMDQTREPFVADEAEAVVARRAADSLKAVAEAHESVKVSIDPLEGGPKIIVPLPAPAVAMFHAVLEAMANRTPISLIPYEAELSTQQAADYLNVSRPYLVRKLDAGELPSRKVGTHRRVQFSDLVAYEQKCRAEQSKALEDLHAEERALGLE
ncbi:helix-turn-helix domain-containing protein [Paracoccus niistensis]|uniref:Helix-turn-helix domain-containing protein n=1 Tax=Paracoccus niistensis TaxID=632935 RepID=A0ABV6I2N8_9RHOB